MNEKQYIPKPSYNPKRICRKICITIAKHTFLTSELRCKLLQMGGGTCQKEMLYWI